jgi:hypothetical protein
MALPNTEFAAEYVIAGGWSRLASHAAGTWSVADVPRAECVANAWNRRERRSQVQHLTRDLVPRGFHSEMESALAARP